VDYRWKTYTDVGYTESKRRVGFDLYCRETLKEERVDVLWAVFTGIYLGEGSFRRRTRD
jgi:hypothetical protein